MYKQKQDQAKNDMVSSVMEKQRNVKRQKELEVMENEMVKRYAE